MDTELILQHLALADEHVALGQKNIDQQMALIAELEIGGHDATRAKALLTKFLELQTTCEANRERLLQQLTARQELQP